MVTSTSETGINVRLPVRDVAKASRRRTRRRDVVKVRRRSWVLPITPKIARRDVPHGSGVDKTRGSVEQTFACLHQSKRLRIRYEIRADLHLGLLQLACRIICWRRPRTSF